MRLMGYLGRIAFRGLIWALAGALFGGVFAGLARAFELWGLTPWSAYLLAAGFGGAITASFFGAMQVALIGTLVGVLTAIGYLVAMHGSARLLEVVLVAALAGVIVGALLSTASATEKRPLGQILSGLVSGAVAGPATRFLAELAGIWHDIFKVSVVAVAFVGVLFIFVSRWVLAICSEWIAAKLSGPLVAAINAASVAACMWLVASTADTGAGTAAVIPVDRILLDVPLGVMGGALGGALGGVLLGALGLERSEYRI